MSDDPKGTFGIVSNPENNDPLPQTQPLESNPIPQPVPASYLNKSPIQHTPLTHPPHKVEKKEEREGRITPISRNKKPTKHS